VLIRYPDREILGVKMELEVEHSPNAPGFSKWVTVRLTYRCNDGLIFSHRYSSIQHLNDGSLLVSYFTPKGKYFQEKLFKSTQYETAWRFMWRTAMGEKG
jgi:hypothetical protein